MTTEQNRERTAAGNPGPQDDESDGDENEPEVAKGGKSAAEQAVENQERALESGQELPG